MKLIAIIKKIRRRRAAAAQPASAPEPTTNEADAGWTEAKRRIARINELCELRKREAAMLKGGRLITEPAPQVGGPQTKGAGTNGHAAK